MTISISNLTIIAGSLFGLCVGAGAATKDVDIVVTHGSTSQALTTYTFKNYSGTTLPAGQSIIIGQGFRYGDVMPGFYPEMRNNADDAVLSGQQWDEISTWRENGGNGSWRHAVATFRLPNSLAPGAAFTVKFFTKAGSYSATTHQTLAKLCTAHDYKIRLTDVRNIDDTVRDSGAATVRLCDNISNVGRDAPVQVAKGAGRDTYIVKGLFSYDTTGHKDPLLYAWFVVDVTTAADGSSLGDVRWVFRVDNSWMNVAAGTTGNAGNPGPAGFVNDPQTITYRPSVLDGAVTVLDWSGLDATVSGSDVRTTGCGGDANNTPIAACLNVASSTGTRSAYYGGAARVTSSGTPIGGLTNNGLYYVYPNGLTNSAGANTQLVTFMSDPFQYHGTVMTSAAGSGPTSLSYRLPHTHWMSWLTLDATGDENWSAANGTTRTTRRVFPFLTVAERQYWEKTGLVIPVNLNQTGMNSSISWSFGATPYYSPLGMIVGHPSGSGGAAPTLGSTSEWASQAFIRQREDDYALARNWTLVTPHLQFGSTMNEATGRIPALNNGPPTGPAGNGVGTPYHDLGAPFPEAYFGSGIAAPGPGKGGLWGDGGTGAIDHEPSVTDLTYLLLGSRHYLDLMHLHGTRLQALRYRPDTKGDVTFSSVFANSCCQRRGPAWIFRDTTLPAALGGDENEERVLFNDILTENNNFYPKWQDYLEGAFGNNWHNALVPPAFGGLFTQNFVDSYLVEAAYLAWTHLHSPLAKTWLSKYAEFYEGILGETAPNHLSAYYGIQYLYGAGIADGGIPRCNGSIGPATTSSAVPHDAADFGLFGDYMGIHAASGPPGQITDQSLNYTLTVGDTIKLQDVAVTCDLTRVVDQLDPKKYYKIIGPIDNTAHTFFIENPATPGLPFTSWTRNGVPIVDDSFISMLVRPQFSLPTGYAAINYIPYTSQAIYALKILGYSVDNAYRIQRARAGDSYWNSVGASHQWWDVNIVVPGSSP